MRSSSGADWTYEHLDNAQRWNVTAVQTLGRFLVCVGGRGVR